MTAPLNSVQFVVTVGFFVASQHRCWLHQAIYSLVPILDRAFSHPSPKTTPLKSNHLPRKQHHPTELDNGPLYRL